MRPNWNRRVIPRWRASVIAASLPECSSINSNTTIHAYRRSYPLAVRNVESKLIEWRKLKTIGEAADLLNFAHIPGTQNLLREPAEQIMVAGDSIPLPLRKIAKKILNIQVNREVNAHIDLDKHRNFSAQINNIKKGCLKIPVTRYH